MGKICDAGDRIFVVDARRVGNAIVEPRASKTPLAGSVVVISRADGKRTDATIAAGSFETDECGGTGGGHAGCSEQSGLTVRSSALGADELFLGNFRRFLLVHGGTYATCRDSDAEPWFALCSTPTWFAVIGTSDRRFIRIYQGRRVAGWDAEPPMMQEDVESKPDGRFVGKRATLVMGNATGEVELDGKRESCLAMYRPNS
jgi:hypothetical protein